MPNYKISQLSTGTSIAAEDLIVYVDDPYGSPVTKQISWGIASREKLVAARSYYVRKDGSDSHSGLVNSAAGAWLTIQHAVDEVAKLDIAGYTVTINVGDGTYAENITLKNVVGFAAAGNLIIKGNSTTPANVVVSSTSADCFKADGISSVWDIKDMKLTTATGTYSCIYALNGATIRFGNIDFGSCTHGHIYSRSGRIQCIANYTISGGANYHWIVNNNGFLFIQNFTITLTGTPSFYSAFVIATQLGMALVNNNTYSGSATGSRYSVTTNGVINSGATLPGDSDGSTATGGQYV